MKVRVQLFAGLKCANQGLPCSGQNDFGLELDAGMKLEDLLDLLAIPRDLAKILIVNGLLKPADYSIADGDEIAIFPPVGGG